VEEQADGHEGDVGVVPDGVEEVALWRFQDKSGNITVCGCKVRCERCSDTDPVRDDLVGRDAAGGV